jgi:hypothetical protein
VKKNFSLGRKISKRQDLMNLATRNHHLTMVMMMNHPVMVVIPWNQSSRKRRILHLRGIKERAKLAKRSKGILVQHPRTRNFQPPALGT